MDFSWQTLSFSILQLLNVSHSFFIWIFKEGETASTASSLWSKHLAPNFIFSSIGVFFLKWGFSNWSFFSNGRDSRTRSPETSCLTPSFTFYRNELFLSFQRTKAYWAIRSDVAIWRRDTWMWVWSKEAGGSLFFREGGVSVGDSTHFGLFDLKLRKVQVKVLGKLKVNFTWSWEIRNKVVVERKVRRY